MKELSNSYVRTTREPAFHYSKGFPIKKLKKHGRVFEHKALQTQFTQSFKSFGLFSLNRYKELSNNYSINFVSM